MSNELLIASVPEPEAKRIPLWKKAGEYERKLVAPASERPLGTSVKNAIARPFAASISRATTNKASKPGSGSLYGRSIGPGPRVPSNNPRPKTSNGNHARSKSHHQGMRPGTAMQQQRDDDDEDDRLDRKGVPPFPISTNPKETLKVSKNAHSASNRRPISLNVAPKRPSHLSAPRATSSPCTLRSCTPVTEEPTDTSCDEICTNLGALGLGAPEAANRGSRV